MATASTNTGPPSLVRPQQTEGRTGSGATKFKSGESAHWNEDGPSLEGPLDAANEWNGLVVVGERDVAVDRLAVSPDSNAALRLRHDLEPHFERLWRVGERGSEVLENRRICVEVVSRVHEPDVNRVREALHLESSGDFLGDVIDVRVHFLLSA